MTNSAINLNSIMLAFHKERSNFDQQGDKGTYLGNRSMGCIRLYIFFRQENGISRYVWKCSKKFPKVKATAPGSPYCTDLLVIVANYSINMRVWKPMGIERSVFKPPDVPAAVTWPKARIRKISTSSGLFRIPNSYCPCSITLSPHQDHLPGVIQCGLVNKIQP